MRAGPLLFMSVVLAVVYVGLAVALPAGAFFDEAEGVRWLQVDSLRGHRWTSLAIDPPGMGFDPEHEYLPALLTRTGETARSTLPASLPLLASIPYVFLGTRGVYLVPAFFAILCLVATARLAGFVFGGEARPWVFRASLLVMAICPLTFLGATFRETTLSVALATVSLIPLCKSVPTGTPGPGGFSLIRAGLLCGVVIGFASIAGGAGAALLVPAVVMAGLIVWGWRRFGVQALTATVAAGSILYLHAQHHRSTFGVAPHGSPSGWGQVALATVAPILIGILLGGRIRERVPMEALFPGTRRGSHA